MQETVDIFDVEDVVFRRYLPDVRRLEGGKRRINEWDIPHTISALSYLVHSDYRYYGKFPSVVAGQILEQLPRPPLNIMFWIIFVVQAQLLLKLNFEIFGHTVSI